MIEHTIVVTGSCGHTDPVEVVPGREVEVRAQIAAKPCPGCRLRVEAVKRWQAGDNLGTQEVLEDLVGYICASGGHRSDQLISFIGGLV